MADFKTKRLTFFKNLSCISLIFAIHATAANSQNLCRSGYISFKEFAGERVFEISEAANLQLSVDNSCDISKVCSYDVYNRVGKDLQLVFKGAQISDICRKTVRSKWDRKNPNEGSTIFVGIGRFERKIDIVYKFSGDPSFNVNIQIYHSATESPEWGFWHGDYADGRFLPLVSKVVQIKTGDK